MEATAVAVKRATNCLQTGDLVKVHTNVIFKQDKSNHTTQKAKYSGQNRDRLTAQIFLDIQGRLTQNTP